MTTLTLSQLFSVETITNLYQRGLDVADALGLPVTSWRAGDPTRSLYWYTAEILNTLETAVSDYIKSDFLDYASGDWLTFVAEQKYGVERIEATYAAGDLTLSNAGTNQYDFDPGDLTFYNSTNQKTYHSTTGGTLAPSGTLVVSFEADEAGADSSAALDEIDELVTTFLDVSISTSEAAIGVDEQSDVSLREQCRDSLGALSPNGPLDAYTFVAKNSDLTGVTEITKADSIGNSVTGDVSVYLAGPTGAVSSGSRDAAEAAILQWATPLCVTPTVASAANVPITITATVEIYSTVGETESAIQTAVQDALSDFFASDENRIGGDDGALHASKIESVIFSAFPGYIFNVTLSSPSGDTSIAAGQIATISGTPSITVVFV